MLIFSPEKGKSSIDACINIHYKFKKSKYVRLPDHIVRKQKSDLIVRNSKAISYECSYEIERSKLYAILLGFRTNNCTKSVLLINHKF